tara:strand:- start:17 stop:463 length:447 start_codon:yes stop_codon:yes gene_type:complete
MPYKDPVAQKEYLIRNKERIKEYQKEYRRKNKDRKKQFDKEYRENNKDKIKEYNEKNKEKIIEYNKVYSQSPTRKKSIRISHWKVRGVIHDDFNELYEKYISTEFCELCNVELTVDKTKTKTTRCLDHDHTTGEFRNVICHSCNVKRR